MSKTLKIFGRTVFASGMDLAGLHIDRLALSNLARELLLGEECLCCPSQKT
jgi:hypothetical protein